jgi:hypothetical protein
MANSLAFVTSNCIECNKRKISFYYTGDNTIPTTISDKDASLSTFDISNRKRHMKRLQKFITCKSKECLKRRDLFFDLNQSTAYNDILRLLHSIQFEVTKANELAIKELLLICYPVFLTHSDICLLRLDISNVDKEASLSEIVVGIVLSPV